MADLTDSALQGAFASPFVTEVPPAAVMRLLSRYERKELASFVAVAIDLLDLADGDPDLEGSCDEDEISRCTDIGRSVLTDKPGCEIADTGENAWIEWDQMRGSQKRGPNVASDHEDAEEDDPSGQYDEDYYTGTPIPLVGAGCPIADPGGCEHDGREPDYHHV